MASNPYNKIVVNCRTLDSHITGVPRYLRTMLAHLPAGMRQVRPSKPLSGLQGHAWEQLRLPTLINQGEILWSPSHTGPLTIASQVVTIHDLVSIDHPEWLTPRFAAWYHFLIPRLVRRARRIIVISKFTHDRLIERTGINPDKVDIIHRSIDPQFKLMQSDYYERMISRLDLPSRNYVLSVCSLEPRKNLARLLQAWSDALANLPDNLWLVLAGARGKMHIFQNAGMDKLPARVHLTGYIPDEYLPALYAGAQAFIYISYYEGFGLPPLEAMACGCPVICSDIPVFQEVVGDAAMKVNPFSTQDIAAGIAALLQNAPLRDALRARGFERIRLFTPEREAQQTWRSLAG